ncbi:hypothetical protein [Jannaschia sp. LMIT008]|uniref:hypothetical protein n=1 Tax=Jannaschia maritima TaxID=3032585 RepID=UPI002810D9C6|nr:hypothetical protein [Jannaschia sp. LMIT008]
MPLTVARIETIRTACYAALGLTFLTTAVWTLATQSIPPVPSPVYAVLGLAVAAILFAVSAFAPRRAVDAAYDEGADRAWLRATAFGYWVGIGATVVLGNLIALGRIPPGPAFMGAAMLMAAAPFAHFLLAEARRGR